MPASFVDRLPGQAVADRFGYTPGYVRLLRHQYATGKIGFSESDPEGATARYRVTSRIRQKIRTWRRGNLSAGEINQEMEDSGGQKP